MEGRDSLDFHLDIKDVYEIAADIASGFEKIVDCCHRENINPLISKVICALEYLESATINLERREKELLDVKDEFALLASRKVSCLKQEMKLEKDMEQIEESWQLEIDKLKLYIKKLQSDKKHLQVLVDHFQSFEQMYKEKLQDEYILKDLRNVIASLTNKLEEKNRETQKQAYEHDILHSKIKQLSEVNKNLSLHFAESEMLVKLLNEEKADLIFQAEGHSKSLQNPHHEYNSFLQKANLEKDVKLCESCKQKTAIVLTMSDNDRKLEDLIQVHDSLSAKISRLEKELEHVKHQNQEYKSIIRDETSKDHAHGSFNRSNIIRDLFQLFLGVLSFEPRNFRFSSSGCA